ncbi:MAG: hypothetical protein H0V12_10445 [Chloroflexi bacterium]|nr:hypothetical protein [Chloroflexota bacterium]
MTERGDAAASRGPDAILVTDMGAFSAAGIGVEALWQAAVSGRSPAAWHKLPGGESRALAEVFGRRLSQLPISWTKPITGHCLGATPALEAIIAIRALETGCLPPTINRQEPDADCPLDVIPDVARPADVRVAMSNSLGFWGYQASLMFTRVP